MKDREHSYDVVFDPDTGFKTHSDEKSRKKNPSLDRRSYGGLRVRAKAVSDWVIRNKPPAGEDEGKRREERGERQKQQTEKAERRQRRTLRAPKRPTTKRKR